MNRVLAIIFLVGSVPAPTSLTAQEKPYITTRRPITLLSANDGEIDPVWRQTDEGLIDYDIKTKDSFTVIRLSPDNPPVSRTYYGKLPCTIIGTPTMAMSKDARYGLITNHGLRFLSGKPTTFPEGTPLRNADINGEMLLTQNLAPPYSNMMSMIDLNSKDCAVVDRVLFDDEPAHVLAHPDGEHFIVGGAKNFYIFKIRNGKLVEVGRSSHKGGLTCFWINPKGHRLIAALSSGWLRESGS